MSAARGAGRGGRRTGLFLLAGLALAALIAAEAAVVVPEGAVALAFRFGRLVAFWQKPGLHLVIPFIDRAQLIEARLRTLAPPSESVILGDQKRLEVATYAEYRIRDPLRFTQTLLTPGAADLELRQMIGASLRRVLGKAALPDLLSPKRAEMIAQIRREVAETAAPLGIEVVDVRIREVDLPAETSQAIYDRMVSERQREAKELRAEGSARAQEIMAEADAERAEILSRAELDAARLRAAADEEAGRAYAEAFAQDPGFFAFYRMLASARGALAKARPTLLLAPPDPLAALLAAPPAAPATTAAPASALASRPASAEEGR